MPGKLIYLDNAATSFPKPEQVYKAHDKYFRLAGNAGRGGHKLSIESARVVFESRLKIAQFLGVRRTECLVFTGGCTESINIALNAWYSTVSEESRGPLPALVSALEHNAVMRPLHAMEMRGEVIVHKLAHSPGQILDLDELQKQIATLHPKLLVLQHGNNVTGEVADLLGAWKICRQSSVSLLVDAAQTAGCLESELKAIEADFEEAKNDNLSFFWCASAHKSLLGPIGVGLLYVAAPHFAPLIYGGTGSHSEQFDMPLELPARLEAGSQPVQAIAALSAGVGWLEENDLSKLRRSTTGLLLSFREWCLEQPYIKIVGDFVDTSYGAMAAIAERRLPTLSIQVEDAAPSLVADILNEEMGIAVRSGLHCSSFTHASLDTIESGGLTRVSFGFFNTFDDLQKLCDALALVRRRLQPARKSGA
jgi:selenocysteine lyase/cysteine desulfurase